MNNKQYFVPDYMLKFKCSMCASCCKDWNIRIDKATMKYFEQIAQNDKNFASELRSNIRINEDGTGKVLFISSGDKKDSGKPVCPFLTEQGLCSIQLRYGTNALPDIAKQYPRIIFLTEKGFEMSLDYSCPTAAELLKERNQVKFYSNPEGFEFAGLREKYKRIGNLSERKDDGKASYFQLERLLIKIIQFRELSINERLALAGIIVGRICNDYINGIDSCLNGLNQEFVNQMKAAKTSPRTMILAVKKAVDKRISLQCFHESEMKELYDTAYVKLGLLNDVTVSSKGTNTFLDGYKKMHEPFEADIQHIYENYFVNYIFSKRFYIHAYKDAYFLMVLLYVLTRFFTICKCLDKGQIVNEDMLVETIRTLDHSLGHLNGYFETVIDLFNNESTLSFPYILSLIFLSKDDTVITLSDFCL